MTTETQHAGKTLYRTEQLSWPTAHRTFDCLHLKEHYCPWRDFESTFNSFYILLMAKLA